ncbi:hypothetical protein ACS0TY_020807 [Phlomoides rotata]
MKYDYSLVRFNIAHGASSHLKEATSLISAALSTANPPLTSLSLSPFINTLTQHPQTQSKHREPPGCPRKAVKIFQWVSRPDFPGGVKDLEFYAALIDGFFRNWIVLGFFSCFESDGE